MADVKWIKITTDMFDNRKIKHLRRLPDGDSIVLIWVMLLTLAGRCNSGGMIFLTENIPYTPKMLADELDFEESTVQLALNALEQLGMIQTNDDGFLAVTGWEKHQNIEGMEKIRESKRLAQARWRAKQTAIAEKSTVDSTVDSTRISVDHAEEEKEEDKNKKEKENKSVRETTHTLFARLLPDYLLSDSLQDKMGEWVKYKTERKEPYKEQGMKSLLRQVENKALQYGDDAVCSLIDECMANNWKGIIFDRLQQSQRKPASGGYHRQTKAEELNDFYTMAENWSET